MEKIVSGVRIQCVKGDIASQEDITAIVNAANSMLRTGGGVAGAIHRAAGPGLEDECEKFAPIEPGEVVISGAHDLPNEFVIHCLGPVYGKDKPEDKLLADCYRNTLKLADGNMIDSIAFPALSTGAFGYPFEEATAIALKTVTETLPQLDFVRLIRFVLFSEKDLKLYEKELSKYN